MSDTLRSLAYERQAQQNDPQPAIEHNGYDEMLEKVRKHISEEHAEELAAALSDSQSSQTLHQQITDFVARKHLYLPGLSLDELANRIYGDMAGFGFLDRYIHDPEIEEVNGNAWNDIEVVTADGMRKLDERFADPRRAVDTIRKMARLGGLILDNTSPVVDSYLTRGVRISAMIPPLVDSDVGAVFSLRRQRLAKVDREQLLRWQTASPEMLDFLALCVNYGVSVGFAGKTSSGKTTNISWLLGEICNDKRIFSIEETRELDLVQTDETGKVQNRIIQMCTRQSGVEGADVDFTKALRHALRFHPDVIVPAEMRGKEAMVAQEAARTGHTVVTSLHANSAEKAYGRILTMCQMAETPIPSHILLGLIVEAFPIMVFCKQLPDSSRRMQEIVEATGSWEGKVEVNTIFRWTGTAYEMVGGISTELADTLLENDAPVERLEKLLAAPKPTAGRRQR